MFSEELAILDRNTVKYMMDEMQNEMDSMRNKMNGMRNEIDGLQGTVRQQADELKEINEKHIKTTINLLRGLNLPDSEIITRICNEFQIQDTQVRQYL